MGTASSNISPKRAEVYGQAKELLGLVPEWVQSMPDELLFGFWSQMRDLLLGETKIPNKYKELIGIAVAGATKCRYCQLFHSEAARLNGATEDEITEAAALSALTMLASTYLNSKAIDFEEFATDTRRIVEHVKSHAPKRPEDRPSRREARA